MAGVQGAEDVTLFKNTATPTHTKTNERCFIHLPVLGGGFTSRSHSSIGIELMRMITFCVPRSRSHTADDTPQVSGLIAQRQTTPVDNLMSWYRDSTTTRGPTTAV